QIVRRKFERLMSQFCLYLQHLDLSVEKALAVPYKHRYYTRRFQVNTWKA
ncbi:MAG: hypothetical protein ACI9C4_003193, partial [Paraglaciecola sp.]